MNNNKKIRDALVDAEKLVKDSSIDNKYHIVAFSEVFKVLVAMNHKKNNENSSSISSEYKKIDTAHTYISFQKKTSAKSHSQKTLCMAYYFHKSNQIAFTKEDIEKTYKKSLMPRSSNTSAELSFLVKQGFIMPTEEKVKGKNTYVITHEGIEYVESKLIKNG